MSSSSSSSSSSSLSSSDPLSPVPLSPSPRVSLTREKKKFEIIQSLLKNLGILLKI